MTATAKTAEAAPAEEPKKSAGKAQTPPGKDPRTMTLAQKFVELRRACPEIVKRQHSDGVKYKFAKIFDVYELLAPAMNEWGVDWEIIGEKSTNTKDNGDPRYFDTYVQHTRNGDRIVWIYEADITIRWINVDRPDDSQEITLHALGTNDGGPDKAKGSAWTYALKYYLFEKFNIDQGEDDPDNADHSSDAPQNAQNGQQGGRNGQGGQTPRQGQQAARNGSQAPQRGGITEAQLNRLYKKGEACGMTADNCNQRIRARYGTDNPLALTRQQYDEICDALDRAAAARNQQGGEANAQ